MGPSEPAPAFEWHMPVAVSFGVGASDHLAEALGERAALVLAFAPARGLGLRERWQAQLGARLLDWIDVADGLGTLARARELARRAWPQLAARPDLVIVAVGGGTTLDLAKLLRCRPGNGDFEALADALRGRAPWPALALAPLWLLPTTAGTGSEVTRWATVWDTEQRAAVKRSLDEPFGWAERAIIDPALSLSCPHDVTRDTALDALAHALEALWNRHAGPASDRLAVSAARRIVATLPACLARPGDLGLRSALSQAALEAGLAFSQTRTALAHALSYAVTLEQGLPHGRACALWLPAAWRLAAGRDARVDAHLAEIFDGIEALQGWLHGVGAGATPEDLGISDADKRIEAALLSPRGRNFIGSP
jgi:phosphonate metabolism-associated iron-containing alcohol dehydrogenase